MLQTDEEEKEDAAAPHRLELSASRDSVRALLDRAADRKTNGWDSWQRASAEHESDKVLWSETMCESSKVSPTLRVHVYICTYRYYLLLFFVSNAVPSRPNRTRSSFLILCPRRRRKAFNRYHNGSSDQQPNTVFRIAIGSVISVFSEVPIFFLRKTQINPKNLYTSDENLLTLFHPNVLIVISFSWWLEDHTSVRYATDEV